MKEKLERIVAELGELLVNELKPLVFTYILQAIEELQSAIDALP